MSESLLEADATPAAHIKADYLIIGAGAMGMAFADEILHGSKTARIVMVDRRAKPGGHWNDAYPFVTLHQPALYYGVNSMSLGAGGRDLVSKAQILAYFELVQKKLEETGRFRFLSQHEYQCDGRIVSILSPGHAKTVRARKLVDATYMDVRVPATSPPAYARDERARVVPINAIGDLDRGFERYVVIGAGKTGIDAALQLLAQGVPAEAITWIMPGDSWFLNRDSIQPEGLADDFITQLRVVDGSESLGEILRAIERSGGLLRLDENVWPTKYRCATVTRGELEVLRRIRDVVRLGRVSRIDGARMELASGDRVLEEKPEEILYIDCTADGLAKRPPRPIFEPGRITLQSISMCQQVMSAAAIAALELRAPDEASAKDEAERDDRIRAKNEKMIPVPHPVHPPDYLHCLATTIGNQERLGARFAWWFMRKRLSSASHMSVLDMLRFLWTARKHPVPDEARIASLVAAD